jgi:hypothetical protein
LDLWGQELVLYDGARFGMGATSFWIAASQEHYLGGF